MAKTSSTKHEHQHRTPNTHTVDWNPSQCCTLDASGGTFASAVSISIHGRSGAEVMRGSRANQIVRVDLRELRLSALVVGHQQSLADHKRQHYARKLESGGTLSQVRSEAQSEPMISVDASHSSCPDCSRKSSRKSSSLGNIKMAYCYWQDKTL